MSERQLYCVDKALFKSQEGKNAKVCASTAAFCWHFSFLSSSERTSIPWQSKGQSNSQFRNQEWISATKYNTSADVSSINSRPSISQQATRAEAESCWEFSLESPAHTIAIAVGRVEGRHLARLFLLRSCCCKILQDATSLFHGAPQSTVKIFQISVESPFQSVSLHQKRLQSSFCIHIGQGLFSQSRRARPLTIATCRQHGE